MNHVIFRKNWFGLATGRAGNPYGPQNAGPFRVPLSCRRRRRPPPLPPLSPCRKLERIKFAPPAVLSAEKEADSRDDSREKKRINEDGIANALSLSLSLSLSLFHLQSPAVS